MIRRDDSACPICSSSADIAERQGRDSETIRCTRCGSFEISGTALAMLDTRLGAEPHAHARLSHAIRIRTSKQSPVLITSTNLDVLVQQPLPGVEKQLENVVAWLAAELADDKLGRIPNPWPNMLAGVVGAVDEKRVQRLLRYGKEHGILELDDNEALIGLTPAGWKLMDSTLEPSVDKMRANGRESETDIVVTHCNACGGQRDSRKRASYTRDGTDGEVSWSHTYDVLECCGCHNVTVKHTHWFSEWDQIEGDPLRGEARIVPGEKVTIWPPPTKRPKPNWTERLEDRVLREVIEEVYLALSSGMIVLASIGTRTLLDRAMTLCIGDKQLSFKDRIDLLRREGYVGETECDILAIIIDAGSASAHRAFSPTPEILDTIVATVENFLERQFILRHDVKNVELATPPRKMDD